MKAKWNIPEPGPGSFQYCCGVGVGLSVRMWCYKHPGKSVQTAQCVHALGPLVEDASSPFPRELPSRTLLDVWLGKASDRDRPMSFHVLSNLVIDLQSWELRKGLYPAAI